METQSPPTTHEVAEAVLLDADRRAGLIAYARSRFGIGREEAEDLLQDTALEVLRHRGLVRSPDGFVFTIFAMRCRRYLAARYAQRELFASASPEVVREPPSESQPPSGELRLALREAFSGISIPCRRLLQAYYVEGHSLREAATRMALAYSGVWKTIHRCLRKLRRCLA